MPIFRYLFGVGGALLCLMFVLNAYVPKAPPRDQQDIDKSSIHVAARPTGDYVIDHFPAVRGDLAVDPAEAVRQAMAMDPESSTKHAGDAQQKRVEAAAPPPGPRKRRVAQRAPTRLAAGEQPSPPRSSGWSDNGWSQNWSSGGSSGWSNNWSHGSNNNHWANNNQWSW